MEVTYQSENTITSPYGILKLCFVENALYDPCSPLNHKNDHQSRQYHHLHRALSIGWTEEEKKRTNLTNNCCAITVLRPPLLLSNRIANPPAIAPATTACHLLVFFRTQTWRICAVVLSLALLCARSVAPALILWLSIVSGEEEGPGVSSSSSSSSSRAEDGSELGLKLVVGVDGYEREVR